MKSMKIGSGDWRESVPRHDYDDDDGSNIGIRM